MLLLAISIVQIILLAAGSAAAFSSPHLPLRHKLKRTSHIKLSADDELEEQIRALNKMIGVDDESNDILITTSKRQRNLEREIELLWQLHPDYLLEESNPDSAENEIIAKFWSIWYGECGASNEKVLRAFEEELISGDPSTWNEAEVEYLALIEKHCGNCDAEGNGDDELDLSLWIEPANRLATLLYMMGRHEESKMWCERILDAKPWHIGALSGIILVCMQLNDQEGVKEWASKGMPKLSEETYLPRKEWVERNVAIAKEKLSELEEVSRNYMKVSRELETSISEKVGENDDMAWQ